MQVRKTRRAVVVRWEPLTLDVAHLTPLQRTLVVSQALTGPLRTAGGVVVEVVTTSLAIVAGMGLLLVLDGVLSWLR